MKEKNISKGEELESINNELFSSFDPDDESWIAGGSKTITSYITYSPCCVDASYDYDISFAELDAQSNPTN